jgi:chromosome segregation ATPase
VTPGTPTDDSPLSLLRAQLERVDAHRAALARALADEKAAREADAVELGEMMARVSIAETRTSAAQAAVEEITSKLDDERRLAAEREARHALLRAENDALRADAKRLRTDAPPRPAASGVEGSADDLQRELHTARAEADRLRGSLHDLQRRAATIGAGLQEMRDLMVQSAALFDELEEREKAIGEIRARSLREARMLFLRAAGRWQGQPGPPPLPGEKGIVEDLSEAAELLEEEVRASMRPKS